MRRFTLIALVNVLTGTMVVDQAIAQRGRGDNPIVTFELFGGAANYGSFLEQATFEDFTIVDDMVLIGARAERELTASNGYTLGGSIGALLWEQTMARFAFTWSPTELEFEDDTGTESELLDISDITDLATYTLSLDVMRFLLDPTRHRFAPYINGGVALTWWSLDQDEGGEFDGFLFGDNNEKRWGGVGGLGLHIGLSQSWAARLEASTFGIGNPFDGDDAFRIVDPAFFTFDEPNTVRLSRFTIALTYSVFDGDPLFATR